MINLIVGSYTLGVQDEAYTSISFVSFTFLQSTYSAKLGCCGSPCFPVQFLWKVKNIYIKLQKNLKKKLKNTG